MMHEELTRDIIGAAMDVLAKTGLNIGLFINFKQPTLNWKRVALSSLSA